MDMGMDLKLDMGMDVSGSCISMLRPRNAARFLRKRSPSSGDDDTGPWLVRQGRRGRRPSGMGVDMNMGMDLNMDLKLDMGMDVSGSRISVLRPRNAVRFLRKCSPLSGDTVER